MKMTFFLFSFIFSINLSYAQSNQDSLQLDLVFDTITQNSFQKIQYAFIDSIKKDSSRSIIHQMKRLGLTVTSNCDQICEAFLIDNKTGKRMWLPSNYDAGVLGFEVSPSGKYFIVFSAYDGPDYTGYYDWRSEFFIYKITDNTGLDAFQFISYYYEKDWSIDDIVWIDDHSIALRIYEEGRWGNGEHLSFKYLKTKIR